MKSDPSSRIYEFGEFRIDAGRRLLLGSDNVNIPLTPKIFDTLIYLVENSGKVIGKDELMSRIWTDTIVEENNLNKNISVLRQVLGEKPGEHRYIVTVPGHGYKFVAEVTAVDAGPDIANLPIFDAPDAEHSVPVKTHAEMPASHARRNYVVAGAILLIAILSGLYFWRTTLKPQPSGTQTIAVLPFKSLSAESRNEALEIGMADSLISKLGSEDVIVRPLGSVSQYVDLKDDALNVGRELQVDSVLDGTIQTSGGRMRVSAKLLRVGDGKQLWAGQFDETFTDIFALQDSISEKVAAALKIRLGDNEKKHYTQNVEAYQLYMQGRIHVVATNTSEIERAVAYFQQAIEADPNYALAYVWLADAYRGLAVGGEMPSGEYFPKAKAAAQKAIELDDTLADAHAILGHIIFWYDWDWNAAEIQYKRALELDPNNANAHLFYAHLLSCTGRHADALAEVARARELDPNNLRINTLQGLFLLHAGQTDDAMERLQKTVELVPNYQLAHSFLARAFIEKGMFAEAVAEAQKSRDLSPFNSEPIAFGAFALAKAGRLTEARAGLNELLKLSDERYVPPYNIALVYDGLGDQEKALDYLDKAFASKDVRMVFLKVEPKWNDLHSDPRFADLVSRMKL